MAALARQLRRKIHQFFPLACAGCDGHVDHAQGFCGLCAPTVIPIEAPACAICQIPMERLHGRPSDYATECGRCRQKRPHFRRVHALWEYEGAVADAIRRIKYGSDFPALRALMRAARHRGHHYLAGRAAKSTAPLPIFTVPSHPRELRRRGFHLPSMALRLLLCDAPVPTLVDRGLVKPRPTPPQAGLRGEERRKNIRNAFAFCSDRPTGGTALVFDDVMTTGATANEAARVLLAAGFDTVDVLVLARAITA